MTPLAYRVADRRDEAADVVTIDLVADGAAIDEPAPGQFTMLYAFGAGEAPISVSGCPADDGVLRHTVRAAGPVTRALCDLAPGDPVGVRGPYGTGWPLDAAAGRDVVVIAGGIGLAPLRPVVQRLVAERGRFERVALVAGTRTPGDLLFAAELTGWRGRFDLDVEFVCRDGPVATWAVAAPLLEVRRR
jgi:NAD(P)H-flavin reductase